MHWDCPYVTHGNVGQQERDPWALELMRVSRSQLRKMLLGRVTSGAIQWGKVCTSAMPADNPGGQVQLGFSNGSAVSCDLLVIADGMRSKLRRCLLPQEANSYTGICMLMVRSSPLFSPLSIIPAQPSLSPPTLRLSLCARAGADTRAFCIVHAAIRKVFAEIRREERGEGWCISRMKWGS